MTVRKTLLVVLVIIAGLPALALFLRATGLVSPVRHSPPQGIDREKLRAEIAAKRRRGESIAVRTTETDEWERQKPGVEFVVRGDAMSGVVNIELQTPGGIRKVGSLGGMGRRSLHLAPEPGVHTFTIRMGQGSRTTVVPVEPGHLTRVVVTLTHEGTERKSMRTIVSTYDATVVVERPHPAGPPR